MAGNSGPQRRTREGGYPSSRCSTLRWIPACAGMTVVLLANAPIQFLHALMRGRRLPAAPCLWATSADFSHACYNAVRGAGFKRKPDLWSQARPAISSKVKFPGTMVMGIGKLPALAPAASDETSGPGPDGSVEAPRMRMPKSRSSSISFTISSAFCPSRMISSGTISKPQVLSLRALQPEHGAGLVVLLLAERLLDAKPMAHLRGLDHEQKRQPPARAPGAARRIIKSRLALRALVHDHQELALVAIGKKAAWLMPRSWRSDLQC